VTLFLSFCLLISLTAQQSETEYWSRKNKILTLLQLKDSLKHAGLFPKVFILEINIRTEGSTIEGGFYFNVFIGR